jgi:hypothetical protein
MSDLYVNYYLKIINNILIEKKTNLLYDIYNKNNPPKIYYDKQLIKHLEIIYNIIKFFYKKILIIENHIQIEFNEKSNILKLLNIFNNFLKEKKINIETNNYINISINIKDYNKEYIIYLNIIYNILYNYYKIIIILENIIEDNLLNKHIINNNLLNSNNNGTQYNIFLNNNFKIINNLLLKNKSYHKDFIYSFTKYHEQKIVIYLDAVLNILYIFNNIIEYYNI